MNPDFSNGWVVGLIIVAITALSGGTWGIFRIRKDAQRQDIVMLWEENRKRGKEVEDLRQRLGAAEIGAASTMIQLATCESEKVAMRHEMDDQARNLNSTRHRMEGYVLRIERLERILRKMGIDPDVLD